MHTLFSRYRHWAGRLSRVHSGLCCSGTVGLVGAVIIKDIQKAGTRELDTEDGVTGLSGPEDGSNDGTTEQKRSTPRGV